jgi:hypothetical protein
MYRIYLVSGFNAECGIWGEDKFQYKWKKPMIYIHKIHLHPTSNLSFTRYHLATKNLVYSKFKKGYNSGKNRRKVKKIIIIKLDLDIHKIHLHTAHLTSLSQVIIWKQKELQIWITKRGLTLVKIVKKSLLSTWPTLKIHLHTTPSFNPTLRSQVIIWKPIWDGSTDDSNC